MTILSALLALTVAAVAWEVGCAVWSIQFPERRTWPPQRRDGFVYWTSAIVGPGLNVLLFGLLLLGAGTLGWDHWSRFVVGTPLFLLGAYLSLDGVFRLGKDRTQGHEGALEAAGSYAMSRNPQYTGSMIVYVGLAFLFDSAPGLTGALLSCAWFVLLPFVEEPWLREKLGAPYDEYCRHVPRFLGLQSFVGAERNRARGA